ncbi:lipoprotein [Steroidobacter agaridevorans]|uniref:Lipoprotein n=1 Tax=Steroidobacter agaridevorans TaxID=2695856 RepID=A0A829YHR2_9GAMM|nr:DUF4136 domain-containing protein [Steroidobacter agaridevorans]GFE82814.1 lipoprotein [Steroidobacter agaridevorans]GFE85898.1 lipoprotein [Steroidobacter agaridevorans]
MNAANSMVRCGLTVAVALLAACASKPTIRTNVDPAADFSKYQTYGFFDEVTGRASAYDSFATRYIKTAIDNEMQKRGFQKSSNPQLLVNTHVQTKDKVKVTESPSGYYGYRYGMYGWGAGVSTSVDNYTEGTLNVDVIDSSTSRLLWEGVAVGRIHEKSRDDPQAAIDEVVRQVFEKFPKQPATTPQA